jgi:serine/threonine protein kinase
LLEGHVKEMPPAPSSLLDHALSPDLEELIMSCLSKIPAQRPQSAESLESALAGCAAASTWTAQKAREWWEINVPVNEAPPVLSAAEKTMVIAHRP